MIDPSKSIGSAWRSGSSDAEVMSVFSKQTVWVTGVLLAVLATSAFFMANVVIQPEAAFVSGINVVLFAVPAFWALKMSLGVRDAVLLFVVLGILALVIETSAIITGFPYGHFGYSDLLGYRLFGYAPWTVFLAWTPLVLAAQAIASRFAVGGRPWAVRIVLVAVTLVIFDLVLDPGAVKLGFWKYASGGAYYGVPMSNFVGWLFSGAIAGIVLEIFTSLKKPLLPAPVQVISSTFFIIFFWMSIALFSGMIAPALIGAATLIALAVFYTRFYYAFDDMIVYVDEQDNPIGTAPKLPAHDGDTRLHRAFSVFLFNKRGELLLQQRAFSKKTWPGVWSNSCCGHVMLNETVERAANRRLKYELGIRNVKLNILLPDFRYRAEKDGIVENEICPVLVGFFASEPRPNPKEVHDTKWVEWSGFVHDVSDPANGFSPWAIKEVELLAKEPSFEDFLAGITGRH